MNKGNILIILIFLLISLHKSFLYYDNLDFMFKYRGQLNNINNNITIIDVTNKTLKNHNVNHFLPRKIYGQLIDKLQLAKPKVIGFDICFIEPRNDIEFIESVNKNNNIVFAARITPDGKLIKPLTDLIQHNSYGYTDIPEEEGYVRRIKHLSFNKTTKQYNYSFSLTILLKYLHVTMGKIDINYPNQISFPLKDFGKKSIPLSNTGTLINYIGPANTFQHIAIDNILNCKDINEYKEQLEDKIILIGCTAKTLELNDWHRTSFNRLRRFTGTEINANLIDNLIWGRHIKEISRVNLLLIMMISSLVIAYIFIKTSPIKGFIFLVVVTILTMLCQIYQFIINNTYINCIEIITLYLILYFYSTIVHYIMVRQKKKEALQALMKYISPQIVNTILSGKANLNMESNRKYLTVLFSDIRGFTTMSEKMDPRDVAKLLKEYFDKMVEVVFNNNGTIDKFMGDAIMVIFGAPISIGQEEYLAIKTALEMKIELANLKKKWQKEGNNTIDIGIGINSGDMVVGNLGSEQHSEYTVLGDNVNLASRLESNAKKGQILISEAVYMTVKQLFQVNKLKPIKVKGKENLIPIYEIIDFKEKKDES